MDDVHIISIKSEFCDEKAARPFGGELEQVYLPPETNGGCCFYRCGCRLSPRRPTGSGSAVRRCLSGSTSQCEAGVQSEAQGFTREWLGWKHPLVQNKRLASQQNMSRTKVNINREWINVQNECDHKEVNK